MNTMLYLGIVMAVFGLTVTVYTPTKLKSLPKNNGVEKPSLTAIIQGNRWKSWSVISLVLLLIGIVLIVVSLVK